MVKLNLCACVCVRMARKQSGGGGTRMHAPVCGGGTPASFICALMMRVCLCFFFILFVMFLPPVFFSNIF